MSAGLRERRLRARAALNRAGETGFKPVSSARWVAATRSWNGVVRVRIEHDPIRGVTPEMMRWCFENLGATTTWNGVDLTGPEVSHYHLWHHRDHVAVTPLTSSPGMLNRGFQVGQYSRIQERFNDINERIDARVLTTRLDEEEFTFEVRRGPWVLGRIIHLYRAEGADLRFYAESRIGLEIPVIGWVLNWLVLPWIYSLRTARHWIRHNIEETGRSEQVIPALHALSSPGLGGAQGASSR